MLADWIQIMRCIPSSSLFQTHPHKHVLMVWPYLYVGHNRCLCLRKLFWRRGLCRCTVLCRSPQSWTKTQRKPPADPLRTHKQHVYTILRFICILKSAAFQVQGYPNIQSGRRCKSSLLVPLFLSFSTSSSVVLSRSVISTIARKRENDEPMSMQKHQVYYPVDTTFWLLFFF